MIGLIALFILIVWGIVAFGLAKLLVIPIKSYNSKIVVSVILTGIFFIAPVTDEIIGGFQFRELCKSSSKIIYDEKTARNKTVVYQKARDRKINEYFLPITERYWSYKDVNTGEILVSWKTYDADGGWASHLIGFPEGGSSPYTFNGHCAPAGWWEVLGKLNIKVNKE